MQAVRKHTDADDVTILVRDASGHFGSRSGGHTPVTENDPGIVALRAWGKPLDLHEMMGSALSGAIAFPMISRGALVGIVVCGPKTSGESFAPDEIAALMTLAHGVGVALDSLSRDSGGSIASFQEAIAAVQRNIATMQDTFASELRALRGA